MQLEINQRVRIESHKDSDNFFCKSINRELSWSLKHWVGLWYRHHSTGGVANLENNI